MLWHINITRGFSTFQKNILILAGVKKHLAINLFYQSIDSELSLLCHLLTDTILVITQWSIYARA